jgi:hypothetical protein
MTSFFFHGALLFYLHLLLLPGCNEYNDTLCFLMMLMEANSSLRILCKTLVNNHAISVTRVDECGEMFGIDMSHSVE